MVVSSSLATARMIVSLKERGSHPLIAVSGDSNKKRKGAGGRGTEQKQEDHRPKPQSDIRQGRKKTITHLLESSSPAC